MLATDELVKAWHTMHLADAMAALYEENRTICRYVHSTSRGHQAIQVAAGMLLQPQDWVSPYYRDDSLMLGMGFTPDMLMAQLLAKQEDYFSGGRSYYSHPSSRLPQHPSIIHQSSATGMQAIPATGIAQGLQYLQRTKSSLLRTGPQGQLPLVLCSLGDASITEGEVSEAFQVAVLKKLPIIYLVQDNEWGISVTSAEARAMDAVQYAAGFNGMQAHRVDGTNFAACYQLLSDIMSSLRQGNAGPWLVQAKVPLLGHHTSGVRREFYRSGPEWEQAQARNPLQAMEQWLLQLGIAPQELAAAREQAQQAAAAAFARVQAMDDPAPATVSTHVFAPTPVQAEAGSRSPEGAAPVLMVDAALFAIREILAAHPEAILYGQDVGKRLGGVFREAATLGQQFGDHRVFNTAIHEAYIIGSTAGLSAVGIKPIVEIQFADYVYPGLNQLVSELSKSSYLTNGKFPVQALIRIPCGAYGGGGPYHSGSIESTLLAIKGIKVVYPSNAADMKGLMKAAFYDPNPVVMLEHKGLYWSKVKGTEAARCPEPDADYHVPLGKGRVVQAATEAALQAGDTLCVITYGMGVYWALEAATQWPGQVEVVDLRTLHPLDEELVYATVKKHGRCLVLSEEPVSFSFAEALAGKIQKECFRYLDAPIEVLGALDLPAVPIHIGLEAAMLPTAPKVAAAIERLLNY